MHLHLKSAIAGILAIVLFACSPVRADWINLSGAETAPNVAEIVVLDDRVRVKLEIFVGDLATFSDLVPSELLKAGDADRPVLEQRLQHFAEHGLSVRTPDGEYLPAKLIKAEPRQRVNRQSPYAGMVNPLTRQAVPEPPNDKRVLYVELDYVFGGKPEALSFLPPRDEDGNALVSIGFIAYHKAVPIIDFRYLSREAKLNLDWADPWYSRFDNPNLKRHHKSALMSFLYVEPTEVRHEVLTRVVDLKNWMDLGLKGERYIEPEEWEGLKQRVVTYLRSKNPVTIDGVAGKPIIDRVNFVSLSTGGIKLLETPERLEQSTAIIGVIFAFIVEKLPQKVSVDWELFTDQITRIPATATDPAGPLMTVLEPQLNKHIWENFLKNYKPPTIVGLKVDPALKSFSLPLASLGLFAAALGLGAVGATGFRKANRSARLCLVPAAMCVIAGFSLLQAGQVRVPNPLAGAVVPQPDEAGRISKAVLENIYRAFDFRREEDVYDKLALTVSGEQLTEIYLQNRQAMVLKNQGGARARVKSVEMVSASIAEPLEDGTGFKIRAVWQVEGSVGHWGHKHNRKNQYEANLSIREVGGFWKLARIDLIKEERVAQAVAPILKQ